MENFFDILNTPVIMKYVLSVALIVVANIFGNVCIRKINPDLAVGYFFCSAFIVVAFAALTVLFAMVELGLL